VCDANCTCTHTPGTGGGGGTGILYGTADVGGESSQFFSISPTGVYTAIGPVVRGSDLETIDIHPTTGVLYSLGGGDVLAPNLYTINKQTGALTVVGNTGLTGIVSSSFNPVTGELFAFQELVGIFKINLTTGAPTFVIKPSAGSRWEGMAWDP